ncbi:2-dehydropantoate 2-reductase [Sulfurimonas sp. MAG313]|nr:2-dehydropantoate 2-reductase [Sulfurimonas sp. MAG313]MDF1881062.1 2-dehydropantoate 2-reductase [Sulfurimonas sp. MAG313]
MRIAVVGLGGVGGYIGAKLCSLKNEHEIIFIARGEHLQAIKDKGLRLIDVEDEQTYHPSYAGESITKALDIVFLCTKTYHSKEALISLSTFISKDTLLIPIANGVNNKEVLAPLTSAKISSACVYIVSHKLGAGIIKKSTKVFALRLQDTYQDVLEPLLNKAGLRVKFFEDINKEIWKKFVFISAMGSLTSLYKKGMGQIYQDHKEDLVQLLEEIFSISNAEGISLDEKEFTKVLDTASKLPLDAPTSMWLDIQAKGLNELESLSHHIIIKAKEHDLQVPLMQKIYDTLK